MAKNYKITKVIDGKEYTAQFVGASTGYDALDASMNDNGTRSERKYAEYILDNVIVEPKGLTIDDFEDFATANKVTAFGAEVMQGKLKPKKEDKEDKAKK